MGVHERQNKSFIRTESKYKTKCLFRMKTRTCGLLQLAMIYKSTRPVMETTTIRFTQKYRFSFEACFLFMSLLNLRQIELIHCTVIHYSRFSVIMIDPKTLSLSSVMCCGVVTFDQYASHFLRCWSGVLHRKRNIDPNLSENLSVGQNLWHHARNSRFKRIYSR